MAVVYKGRDRMLERDVAIKVLRASFSRDPNFRERFRQEAKAAANLSHPNIVTVYDFGVDQGRLFIVMEYVPGMTLKEYIQKRGQLSTARALSLAIQACAGIGYAHRAGLVHCDVKPQNMLVTPDRRLKVTDFGIARALASIHPDEQSHVVWGSPQYFSPEQASGRAPSPASDVYSLGVTLFEMLTGRLPFEAESGAELARLHREAPPPSPRRFRPDLNEDINRVILKVLSKEPSRRYRTADQLGRVLVTVSKRLEGAESAPSRPAPAASQPQQPAPPPPPQPIYTPPVTSTLPPPDPLEVDWGTALLGLLALLAVGGLIPFWLYIYFTLNP
ncbi:MAG: serine/threonine protein kinase [Anaerolineae bacterium]|nr:MAG: serine/threonine protein kinase [Anaerolineae bacterium]